MKSLLFVVGIFAVLNGATRYADPAGTADLTGGTAWATAMNGDTAFAYVVASGAAGDTFFFKGGVYTLTNSFDFNTRDGSATAPITFIGVKSTTTNEGGAITWSDYPADSASCPIIDLGASYALTTGDFSIFKRFVFRGQAAAMVSAGGSPQFVRCWFSNYYGTPAARYACVTGSGYSNFYRCIFTSTNCGGLSLGGGAGSGLCAACTFSGITNTSYGNALALGTGGVVVIDCVFKNNFRGLSVNTRTPTNIIGNTFHKNDTAITITTASRISIVNNCIDSGKVGVIQSTKTNHNFYSNNLLFGNSVANYIGVDSAGIFGDRYGVYSEPKLNDTLHPSSTSPLINAGLKARQ